MLVIVGFCLGALGFMPEPTNNIPEVDILIKKSNTFEKNRISFPTYHNKISTLLKQDPSKAKIIQLQAQDTYPILHHKTATLIDNFLLYKRIYGTEKEKPLYTSLNRTAEITRLLAKRPLMFMTEHDTHLLRDGTRGAGEFEIIGTQLERQPLILSDYISYDEMEISALLGVSVPTYFINNGSRNNRAEPAQSGTYQEEGIYIGLVGARFEKQELMESKYILITPEQNTKENGYGINHIYEDSNPLRIWSIFYGLHFPTYDEAKADTSGRYTPINNGTQLFDTAVYKERMKVVLEPFLLDAHERGKKANKKVYVHAVGLGLGVWQKIPQQTELMLQVYAEIITNNNLSHISDIDFSWFAANNIAGTSNGQLFKTHYNNITIHFSKRNPADKLTGPHKNKLLVACYAWDGNAYPGNEYWAGMLTASGDPAAACCSLIPELQNPEINSYVSGDYAHIIPIAAQP